AVEPLLQRLRLLFEAIGPGGVPPGRPGQTGGSHFGVIDIPLDLAGGAGEGGQGPVGERDRIPGVFPALVFQTGLPVAPFIFYIAVAVAIAEAIDPVDRPARFW